MPAVIFQLVSVAAFVWISVVQVVQALTTSVSAVAASALRAIGLASSEVIAVYDDYDKVLRWFSMVSYNGQTRTLKCVLSL
jgi:hypothetical protein